MMDIVPPWGTFPIHHINMFPANQEQPNSGQHNTDFDSQFHTLAAQFDLGAYLV